MFLAARWIAAMTSLTSPVSPYILPQTPGDPDAGRPHRTVEGIAWRLGLSPDWIYRAWKRMVRDDKMPSPVVSVSARGKRAPLKWDARGFELWMALQQPPEVRMAMGLAPATPANDTGPSFDDDADTLDQLLV